MQAKMSGLPPKPLKVMHFMLGMRSHASRIMIKSKESDVSHFLTGWRWPEGVAADSISC